MNEPNFDDPRVSGGNHLLSRRHFLKGLAYGSMLALGTPKIVQAAFSGVARHKSLLLEHHHTGETINVTYYENGNYISEALDSISYFLRDYHNGQIHHIDPVLVDQLHDVKLLLGVNKPFHVVSGYRSPETNASLRRQSRGVAKQSLHMEGRAVDIRIEGVSTRSIRDAALTLQTGGVGYYPNANFVHLDSGDIRTWRG